ncbi:MAG: hypothetical protein U9R25_11720 [Chloroflexota bacterium]|nr:hypothetical protein [Chloroflexota bacterium]
MSKDSTIGTPSLSIGLWFRMATEQLHGTVEEQADQLYGMAEEAMEEGRFTGAVRYFAEIERALPGYRDVPQRLASARRARNEQRFSLFGSLLGAMLLIVLARILNASSEWVFLAAGAIGLILGFVLSQLIYSLTAGRSGATADE